MIWKSSCPSRWAISPVFQAERRDMDGESFAGEAEQEVKQYTLDRLRSSMDTYSSVRIKDSLHGDPGSPVAVRPSAGVGHDLWPQGRRKNVLFCHERPDRKDLGTAAGG